MACQPTQRLRPAHALAAGVATFLLFVPVTLRADPTTTRPATAATTRPAATAEQIRQWIADLGAKDYHAREAAEARLLESGEAALGPLAEAARGPVTPEAHTRIDSIARQIKLYRGWEDGRAGDPVDGLRMRLVAEKAEVGRDDGLTLVLEVRNFGSDAVEVEPLIGLNVTAPALGRTFTNNNAYVMITQHSGTKADGGTMVRADGHMSRHPVVKLAPGETMRQHVYLSAGGGIRGPAPHVEQQAGEQASISAQIGPALNAGGYEVSIRYTGWTAPHNGLRTNAVNFKVTDAAGH